MSEPPFTIRIRSENNQDMDWFVNPDEVTFRQTLEVFSQIIPDSSPTAFEYEDEDGDRITVRSDEEMRDMFSYYFRELSDEDRDRGLFPPLIIFPKQPKTPQIRNIHGLKVRTGCQAEEKTVSMGRQQMNILNKNPAGVGFESILRCGEITKESLHYEQMIGAGNGGKIYKTIHKPTGKIMAVKEIEVHIAVPEQRQIILELEILYKCHCRMIISFYGAYFFENRISICTEFMDGGSLDLYMPVNELVLGQISLSVIEGMLYMWNLKILHRDIKPYNILVNTAGQVKLCDFGVSTQLVKSLATTFLGTNVYMAPERLQGHDYGIPAEVWSLGVTLFELATGKLPFATLNTNERNSVLQPIEIMKVIIEEPQSKLPMGQFSQNLIDFVNRCLHKMPALRLSGQDLL
ncbi:dual specificity mitogen-activated protein kinase kinase 5-like isoform X1, partial [Biomphalaria pfeifferi]